MKPFWKELGSRIINFRHEHWTWYLYQFNKWTTIWPMGLTKILIFLNIWNNSLPVVDLWNELTELSFQLRKCRTGFIIFQPTWAHHFKNGVGTKFWFQQSISIFQIPVFQLKSTVKHVLIFRSFIWNFRLCNSLYGAGYKLERWKNNPWFKPWSNVLLHTQSNVCATVKVQCLEYLGYTLLRSIPFPLLYFCILFALLTLCSTTLNNMALWVVEFSNGGYKIRQIFA